ncbi:MAG: MATE family efflux transporter, partial [Lachnospiraceae bacterium]|nr:MATE family efflux transporter [Lachnospiraceae bacterium]
MISEKNTEIEYNPITDGVIWKEILVYFFPILFGTFFQQLYNTVDALIVGRFIGKEAIAAVAGSAGMVVLLVVGFFGGLSTGATVLVSQYYGALNKEKVSKTIHTVILFC